MFAEGLVPKEINVLVGLCFSLRQILMNVQRESLSATTIPAALTCQGGTTVSAEAVSMTMGPIHCPGSPVLVSSFQPCPPSFRVFQGDSQLWYSLQLLVLKYDPSLLDPSVFKIPPSAIHGLGWELGSVGFSNFYTETGAVRGQSLGLCAKVFSSFQRTSGRLAEMFSCWKHSCEREGNVAEL